MEDKSSPHTKLGIPLTLHSQPKQKLKNPHLIDQKILVVFSDTLLCGVVGDQNPFGKRVDIS